MAPAEDASRPAAPVRALRWDGERLDLLDQTVLPEREEWLRPADAEAVAVAIERLAVRGAPNIGIAAGYGLAMAVSASPAWGRWKRPGSGCVPRGRRR